MILFPEFQGTRMNHPCVSRMSFAISLFIMKLTVDWLSISSNHGLTSFTDHYVSFPLFRNDCQSVPPNIRLSISVISASIVSGLLIVSSNTSKNSSKPYTQLQVYSSSGLICILVSSTAQNYFPLSSFLGPGQSWAMGLDFPQLYQYPLICWGCPQFLGTPPFYIPNYVQEIYSPLSS